LKLLYDCIILPLKSKICANAVNENLRFCKS